MTLENLLNGLARAPWRDVARHILARAGYDSSLGLEKTSAAIIKANADATKESKLADGLVEHLVSGEKYIQFIQISSQEKPTIEAWIAGKRAHKNALSDAFPGVADEASITPLRALDPTSVGSVDVEVGVGALYTAARTYVKQVPIPANDLKPQAAAGYDRVVGYKNILIQVYDAIWLPPQGNYVVIAADYPLQTQQSFPLDGALYLVAQLRKLLGRPLKRANFWHAVDGLYKAPDGKLVDYGFSAGGQSVNHHKARRKTAVCLRQQLYDQAGAAALKAKGKELELFKVAMQWDVVHPDKIVISPEVLLPGVAMDLNKASPVLDRCVVRNCLSSRDLQFVASKLLPHIKNWV